MVLRKQWLLITTNTYISNIGKATNDKYHSGLRNRSVNSKAEGEAMKQSTKARVFTDHKHLLTSLQG